MPQKSNDDMKTDTHSKTWFTSYENKDRKKENKKELL